MEPDEAARENGEQQPLPSSPEHPEMEEKVTDDAPAVIASSSSSSSSTPIPNNSFYGKHRLIASISNLQSHIKLFQEELDQLDTLGESSIVCKELVSNVESTSDPLLPLTKGPVDLHWDRWFRGLQNSRRRWP